MTHATSSTDFELLPSKHRRVDKSVKHRILYLFSGPHRPQDGFEAFCKQLGVTCDCIDIEYDESHDLLDEDFWTRLERRLDDYDGYLISPPCSTFTAARSRGDGGPEPLRSTTGAERYGLKGLTPEQRAQAREGTILALRGRAVAWKATKMSKPWLFVGTAALEDRQDLYVHA